MSTSNSDFVQKCGLDAYFFLRYLRMLLKIFVPAACVILPILLPLNKIHGKGAAGNVKGLDQLAWGNIAPDKTGRYWAHGLLALMLVVYVCFIVFDELRDYIRMRQAYLTSPQHRLRASATTVLVSAIPRKWCSVEALDGLYDVYPGGLRNIWVNRNFDELSEKIQRRDKLALALEAAETELIKKSWKANEKKIVEDNKKAGQDMTKEEKRREDKVKEEKGARNAHGHGLTSGNPHQVRHTVQEAIDDDDGSVSSSGSHTKSGQHPVERTQIAIPIIGGGIQVVSQGLGKFGKGMLGGIRGIQKEINDTINTTNGLVIEDRNSTTPADDRNNSLDPHQDHQINASRDPHRNETASGTQAFGANASPTSPATTWDAGRTTVPIDNDQQPLNQLSPVTPKETANPQTDLEENQRNKLESIKKAIDIGGDEKEPVEYPLAFDKEFDNDSEDAAWRKYLGKKDRDTMRLPIFGWQWMIALPLVGEKVDTIYYCRREVARLNTEIEEDQGHLERFPLMNSAFIQFNHQVAAHMACQTLSHHLPKQMAPRLVEIAPNDVVWDNMSIPWWQTYIRTAGVLTTIIAMVLLWAVPIAFTSALYNIRDLAIKYNWLRWVLRAPNWLILAVQGVLPAVFLSLLLFLLPIILRLLAKLQGTKSGMLIELSVQKYYFFFLFIQVFLVVTVSNAVATLASYFHNVNGLTGIPTLLAENIPKASNYFFSYMLLQALSVSAGALVQVGGLVSWFILAPVFDNTARSKFARQTQLSEVQWGTFFPVYTNLACIGLIYSVISPLILVFNIITFALFWFVYRYNTLYVTRFTRDTGGLLYPNAINSTFVGIYILEVALIGLFFLVRDGKGNASCKGQGIGMIVILILTAIYQILLNEAFSPLFRYLPITLEDDAVRRDEEFARAMNKKHGLVEDESEGQDLQDELDMRDRPSRGEDGRAEEYEMEHVESDNARGPRQDNLGTYQVQNPEVTMDLDKESRGYRILRKTAQKTADVTIKKLPVGTPIHHKSQWADRDQSRRSSHFGQCSSPASETRFPTSDFFSTQSRHRHTGGHQPRGKSPSHKALDVVNHFNPLLGNAKDIEAQRAAQNQLSEALFADVNDELEDLTPEQRDILVQRAFQHSALRAKRPVIWLPRDDLGVSDDEVRRMAAFSKNVWVSNVRQGLDGKGRCVYSGAPPDFSEVDVIQL